MMKRILLLLLCFTLTLGAISCTKTPSKNDGNGTQESTAPTDAPSAEAASPYQSIIESYCALMLAKFKDEALPTPDDTASEIEIAIYEIARDCRAPAMMGYATKDINGDGQEELVLLNRGNKVYALFTLHNNSPILLLKADQITAAIDSDGEVCTNQYIENKSNCTQIKKIVNGKLEGLEFGTVIDGENVVHYKIENGIRTEITANEESELSRKHHLRYATYRTKSTGFRFIPAITDQSSPTAPEVDFSSYDGILSAYKIIAESFSEYSEEDWINGKFDSLLTITDNESYDIFHHLFYYGIRQMPKETYFGTTYAKNGKYAFGYAKKDLNNDGIEELILMTDLYKIVTVFTMKDGKVTVVEGTAYTWIDENGFFRKQLSTGGLVDRDGEVFVYEIKDGELKPRIALGYQVNIYLEKEGWYRIEGNSKVALSKEEGEALYAQYDVLPKLYSNEEYTRNFSGLEFVPLFDGTVATDKHINVFTNRYYVNAQSLTVTAVKGETVDFTLRFIYVEGEGKNHVTHEFLVTTSATLQDGVYAFEADGYKGHLLFSVNAAWAILTESGNENVPCRAYLFDYPEND